MTLALEVAETKIGTAQAFRNRRIANEAELRDRRCNHVGHFADWFRPRSSEAPELLDNEGVVRRLHGETAETVNISADNPCDRDQILLIRCTVTHEGRDDAGNKHPGRRREVHALATFVPNQRGSQLVAQRMKRRRGGIENIHRVEAGLLQSLESVRQHTERVEDKDLAETPAASGP